MWNDILGNNLTAQEIFELYNNSGESHLAYWIYNQACELWPNEDVNYDDCQNAAMSLLCEVIHE